MKTLLQYLEDKEKIYIFGIGKKGKFIRRWLEYKCKKIAGFVSSDEYISDKVVDNVPVYPISAFECGQRDCLVIGASYSFYNEIMPSIIERQIPNVFFVDSDEYSMAGFELKLVDLGIDLSKEMLDIAGFKVPNMFALNANTDMILSLDYEFCDLVWPYLGDDSRLIEGPYEYNNVKLKSDDVVLDCGANIGLFSARAASLGCKVYAFEPLPDIRKYLNMVKNEYRNNVSVVPMAAGERQESCEMLWCKDNPGSSNIVGFETRNTETIDVDVISIDEFVNEHKLERVDFIKADIEGAERLMLSGAKETLKRYAPKLSICTYHLPDDVTVLTKLIKEANPEYNIEYGWRKLYAWVGDC